MEAPLEFVASLTVRDASAQLWTSPEARDVVNNLRELHKAILRESLEAYDPSDVFLAIQGACLRFPVEKEAEEGTRNSSYGNSGQHHHHQPLPHNENEYYDDLWSVFRESIWTVAALARVCVGPAWWYQARQRRRFRTRSGGSSRDLVPPHRRQITASTCPDDSSSNNASSMSVHSSPELGPNHTHIHLSSNHHSNSTHSQQPQRRQRTNYPTVTAANSDVWPWYPPIPEVLPAAMLRLTANAIEKATYLRRKTKVSMPEQMLLMEAQLVVLQQLCCASHHSRNSNLIEWNIPGAHEAVGTILAYSLKLLCTGRSSPPGEDVDSKAFVVIGQAEVGEDDNEAIPANTKANHLAEMPSCDKNNWKSILLVTRATTDLLSAGWRPLARKNMAEDVVLSLLVMASRGVKLDDLYASPDKSSKKGREERLVASSCAAEAISALVSLATQGLIPLTLQDTVVRTITRLHVFLCTTASSASTLLCLDPVEDSLNEGNPAEDEEDEVEHETEFFVSQRELCRTLTCDLLWNMLSNETAVEVTIGVCFSIIQTATNSLRGHYSTDSPLFNKLKWNDQTDDYVLQDCAGVMRILSSALWGSPPDLQEISLLRIFWHDAIQEIHQLLTTIHTKFAGNGTGEEQTGPSFSVRSSYFTKQIHPLIVDAVAAFRKVIYAEVRGGSGILSAVEWDAVIYGIEHSVLPWLTYRVLPHSQLVNEESLKKNKDMLANDRIRMETESFLMLVGELMDNCVNYGNAPLMDYSCLRKLHILMLRKASRLLGNKKSETLGLSAVRSWAKFGFFPFRLDGWSGTASELLSEAFSVGPDGRYKHSSAIRLEALESLTFEAEATDFDEEEASAPSYQSLLSMTENMRELHLEIVTNCIIPILKLILLGDDTQGSSQNPPRDEDLSFRIREDTRCFAQDRNLRDSTKDDALAIKVASQALNLPLSESCASDGKEAPGAVNAGVTISRDMTLVAELPEESAELKLYAVKLVGRLFLGVTGERKHRALFISMLERAATGCSCNNTTTEPPVMSVGLEALRQLDLCLTGVFGNIPYAHESVPGLVYAVRKVLKTSLVSMRRHSGHFEAVSALAIAAARILGRLQLHTNNTLAIVPSSTVRKSPGEPAPENVPEFSFPLSVQSSEKYSSTKSLKITVALFVTVLEDEGRDEAPPDRTVFSFEPAARDVLEVLSKTARPESFGARRTQLPLFSLLRKSCFEVLSRYLLSGVQLTLPNETGEIFSSTEDGSVGMECTDETFAMMKALSRFLQLSVASKVGQSSSRLPTQQRCFRRPEALGFGLFISSCKSRNRTLVVSTCQSLCALVPSLESVGGSSVAEDTYNVIQHRLNAEINTFQAFGRTPSKALVQISTALLGVLYEASWKWQHSTACGPLLKTFEICLDIISNALQLSKRLSLHIAVQCILLVIRKLTASDAQEAKSKFQSFYSWYLGIFNKDGLDCKSEEDPYAPTVIHEALEQQCQSQKPPDCFDGNPSPSPLSKHDALTTESDNIEAFTVESDSSRYETPRAAWLCEDPSAIITFRLGCSVSRYRGYVEIVLRSPTTRVRKLVPMPSKLTLEDPEFPLRPPAAPPTHLCDTGQPESPTGGWGTFALKIDSSDVLSHAQSLLERFDSMFPQGGFDALPPQTDDESSYRSYAPRDDETHSVTSASDGGTQMPGTERPSAPTTFPYSDSLYDVSSVSVNVSQREIVKKPQENTMENWLISVFGLDTGSVDELQQYLALHNIEISHNKFGLSRLNNYKFREGQELCYSSKLERAISILDRTTPLNTHKFALLYSGHRAYTTEETKAETLLLSSLHCSPAFHKFANQLGSMTPIRHLKYFSAGLDVSEYESDGRYTLAWSPPEAMSTIIFHVANLMPGGINNRKRHIGNDNVSIVFVDRSSDIDLEMNAEGDITRGSSIVSGQFNFATILVTVLPHPEVFRVTCRIRPGLSPELFQVLSDFAGEDLVADVHAADYVRGLAMRLDLVCRTMVDGLPPPTNCLDRCRQIAEMKRYAT